MARHITSARERFDAKWIPEPNTGCWLWTGYVRDNGYGSFAVDSPATKPSKAHRAAWVLYRGPIPKGMCLDHTCRERSCVNPDHLRVVTKQINTIENSDSIPARNARKAFCPKCKQPYDHVPRPGRPNGRTCRHCSRALAKAYGYRKRWFASQGLPFP